MEDAQDIPAKFKVIGAVAALVILAVTLLIYQQLSKPERTNNYATEAEKAQLDDIRQAVIDGEQAREQAEQGSEDIWDITTNPDYTGESNAAPVQTP